MQSVLWNSTGLKMDAPKWAILLTIHLLTTKFFDHRPSVLEKQRWPRRGAVLVLRGTLAYDHISNKFWNGSDEE